MSRGESEPAQHGRSEVAGPGPPKIETPEISDLTTVRAEMLTGARWTSLTQVITQLSRVFVQLLLARMLIPADFGVVTWGVALMLFFDIFRDLGTTPAIVQRKTVDNRLLSTVFYTNAAMGAIMFALFTLSVPWQVDQLDRPDATAELMVLGSILFLSSLGSLQLALLRRQLRFAMLAQLEIMQNVVSGVVSIALALMGAEVWALVIGQVVGRTLLTVVSWVAGRWHPSLSFSWTALRSISGFSVNLTLFNVFTFCFLNADRFLVGRQLGDAALGAYGLGLSILMAPVRSVSRAVYQLLFPTFARIQDNDAEIGRGYLRGTAAIALITFPAMTGIALLADPLFVGLLGEKWSPAVPVITIYAPIGLLHSMQFTVGTIWAAKGRSGLLLWWGIASGILTVAAYVAGLPWGITGVAAAYGIAILILTYPSFALPFRLIGLRFTDLLRATWPATWMTVTMGAAVAVTRIGLEGVGATRPVVALAGVGVGAFVYGALVLITQPAPFRDLLRVIDRKRDRANGPNRSADVAVAG